MKPRIIVSHGEMNALSGLFSVSLPTVRSALRGHTRTALSENIRELALMRGGVQVRKTKPVVVPVAQKPSAEKPKAAKNKIVTPKTPNWEEKTMRAFLLSLAEANGIKITDYENNYKL